MHCIMKITVIISLALVTQVSASFYDVFQGAVLSVQTSFGKLISDVVTDVRITVDCTILAVEHVLSWSDDATERYYEKCKGGTQPNTPSDNGGQNSGPVTVVPKLEVSVDISNDDLRDNIPAEINATVNNTLSKILDDYGIKNKLESVEDVLDKETERLADVSVLVKDELEKLSTEVNSDIRRIEQNDSPEPSIETVLEKVKLLQDMEQNDRNSSQAKEIHQVVEAVLDKLEEIEDTEASENIRLDEIQKDMEFNSNESFSDLGKQFDEWKEDKSKYLDDIEGKMEVEKAMDDQLTFEDTSNRLSEGPNRTSNTTNQAQLNNTIYIAKNPEIILLPYKYKRESENTTDNLSHLVVNPAKIISTGYTPNNKSSTAATDAPSVKINITEPTAHTSNSIQQISVEESSNLIGVPSSFMSSNLSTSTFNFITTDSPLTTQNIVIDQPDVSSTGVVENTSVPLTDHFTEITNETISTNIFSNYSDQAQPIIHEYIEHYNKSTIMDTDSTVTTYEPFIPKAVSIDEYNDKNEKSSDENKTIVLDNPIKTSDTTVDSTVIHEDINTTHEPGYDLNSSRHFAVGPLIDVATKSFASTLGSSRISGKNHEESPVLPTLRSDVIGSTTEVDQESSVLTTTKPAHIYDQKLNDPDKISMDYNAFFNRATKNSPIHKKAVKDARKLIEDSKMADLIMNSILKHKKAGRSIFNTRAPVNFGK